MNKTIETMANKITDMILNGVTEEEFSQAITESMEFIDLLKKLDTKSIIKIRYDEHNINFDDNMEYNEIFINNVIQYYKSSVDLHCLNDIYDTFVLPRTIAGYAMVFKGPIEMTYEKFDDYFDITIITEPVEVFTSGKYKWEDK